MKRFALSAAVVLGLAGPVLAADPLVGTTWKTGVDDGAYAHVEMYDCAGKICGDIRRSFNASGEYKSKNQGLRIVRDMVPSGGGKYKGNVLRPSDEALFTGRMSVSGDVLKLTGCALGCMIKKTQTWTRVK